MLFRSARVYVCPGVSSVYDRKNCFRLSQLSCPIREAAARPKSAPNTNAVPRIQKDRTRASPWVVHRCKKRSVRFTISPHGKRMRICARLEVDSLSICSDQPYPYITIRCCSVKHLFSLSMATITIQRPREFRKAISSFFALFFIIVISYVNRVM